MPLPLQPPETDLLLPLPGGEAWDPHTIHTHYFGFAVPEAAIGVFLYVRYMPYFPLCQGGICAFQGTDNVEHQDSAHVDFQITMPWPTIDGSKITTDNGLAIDFLEPGRRARVSYASPDGATSVDVLFEAVSPLLARGHVVPGEELHHGRLLEPGGSEQFMHATGTFVLHGERHAVDCHYPRDRSWRQVRTERHGAVPVPPVGWSPMWFGPDLIFNQVSFEPLDTDPAWAGLYDVGDRPSHHFAWIQLGDETRGVTSVRRNVLRYHPDIHLPMAQEVEAVDETGARHRFHGEAIAAASLPSWPNASFHDSVYRWEDEAGRTTHCTYQELWFERYSQAMKRRARSAKETDGARQP